MVEAEPNIKVLHETIWKSGEKKTNRWSISYVYANNKLQTVEGIVLIDATELGDVIASLKVSYYLGMDSKELTNEHFALNLANDIVPDLTYVITLRDFGPKTYKTIKKPKNYTKEEFAGCCDVSDPGTFNQDNNGCFKMLTYGRLPNNRFIRSWAEQQSMLILCIIY